MMAALLARPTVGYKDRIGTPPSPSTSTPHSAPTPVPNRHIPYCSPGPRPVTRSQLETPPATPPSSSPYSDGVTTSLLHPPDAYSRVVHDPPVYALNTHQLADAYAHLSSQPLPLPQQVFPWLHGLHAENHLQLAFFTARRKSLRKTPKCLRGLAIVKVGGDLSHCKLKGAISSDEILRAGDAAAEFLETDPKEGFSVRNFQIQTGKLAIVSDIVVYGDDSASQGDIVKLASRISKAQAAWAKKLELSSDCDDRAFNTFVLTGKYIFPLPMLDLTDIVTDGYRTVEQQCPDLIAIDSQGCITGKITDFFQRERTEMCTMSTASEISHNVWLGPTPDPNLPLFAENAEQHPSFEVYIETSDGAHIPDARAYRHIEQWLAQSDQTGWNDNVVHQLEFPGSGAILPPTWSQVEVDGLLECCQWIYKQANNPPQDRRRRDSKLALTPHLDDEGDSDMLAADGNAKTGRKILIHCTDGYTESSLLALAYYMYAECVPVHEAWLQLHCDKQRNFFAYSSDVHLLKTIQPRLMSASPKSSPTILQDLCAEPPKWMDNMDGSLPSRVMPYMYLGNLNHANNPELLRELGIGQVLSIGEPVNWSADTKDGWRAEDLFYIDRIQDNGVDPLTEEFERCLEFISESLTFFPLPPLLTKCHAGKEKEKLT